MYEKEKIFNYIKERAQDLEETYLKELSVLERRKELLSYGIDISLEDMENIEIIEWKKI